ncbi:PAS domain-containing hybrid sensor histidine kinase/response regulator [Marinimicrobium sp. C2-29]|uniref:PAS domain-containing hybrid sensor histidine kinase/response regulator n=1 Tax=Marinimicrobium sp. C2-29 TaxID=3139825 RepID=UPI003139D0C0
MRTQTGKTFERLSRFRRLTMCVYWGLLTLGLLLLGFYFHELSEAAAYSSSSDVWGFVTEGALLLLLFAVLIFGALVDRKRTRLENQLDLEGGRLQQLTDYVEEVFWLVDARTRTLLYVSPAFESVWGHSCDSLYQDPELWYTAIVAEDRDRVSAKRPFQREGGYDVEYRVERPDGSRRWVHDRAYPIRDENGQVVRLAGLAVDVTERKALVEQLTQRERQLNIANRMARLGGWSLDLTQNEMVLSDEACAICDVAPGSTISLDEAYRFYPPQSLRRISKAVDECIEHKRAYDVEAQLISASGRFVWIRTLGHPVLDDQGRVVGLEGSIQDITDRKHASNLLSQGLQRFRDFADAMPNLIWTADPDGRLDYGNRALEGFLGARKEDVFLDDRWQQAIDPDSRAVYRDAWNRALANGTRFHIEFLLRRFDGQMRWHSLQATPVRDRAGDVVKWYGNATNIHERKLSEEKAQSLAERLMVTLESITDAFYTLDKEWRFTYVNHEAERLLRRSRGELLHSVVWESFPETLGTVFESHFREAVSRGEKVAFEAYYEPLTMWVSVNAYPSREGLSVYFLDITERKRAERERARMRELENSRELAEKASETKSAFLASMSHEIRTPINGIVGMADVLHETSLENDQVEMVDIVRESAQSLLEIVDDILDFSKIEAGKLELSHQPFSPTAVMRSVCLLLDRMACNQDVELTLFTDTALPTFVVGDELRVRQVLLNLLSNAIKFSARQERRGMVKVQAFVLGPKPGDSERDVTIEWRVLDNGIGMKSETLSRLFSPFVQADVSTTRVYGGTGLGLSISYNLVDLMGGDIKVASEPGNGTEFRVRLTLPRADSRVGSDLTPNLAGYTAVLFDGPQDGERIREEHNLIEGFGMYLEAAGARVYPAAEWIESRAETSQPWLAVLDSGYDNPCAAELMARIPPPRQTGVRWLVLGRGRRRSVRHDGETVFRVDANSLSQLQFLRCADLALGRAGPGEVDMARARGAQAPVPLAREEALAQGTLILVAEDNETNRKVIMRQLAMLGYVADLAENGREALKHWEQNPEHYAGILTDLHMPEMDGFELAREVRAREQSRQHGKDEWGTSPVPVIALSANAMIRDDERTQASGINDCLIKPIGLEALQAVLTHWCPTGLHEGDQQGREPGAAEPIHTEPAPEPDAPLDLQVLRNLVGEDEAVVQEFIQSFESSSRELVQRLHRAAEMRDWHEVSEAAHSLKSSARSMGAAALGESCQDLEQAARSAMESVKQSHPQQNGNTESSVQALIGVFNEEWGRTQAALQSTHEQSHS